MNERLRIAYIVPVFSKAEDDWSIPVQHHLVRRLSEHCDVEVFPLRYPLTQQPYPFYSARVFPQGAGLVRGWRRIPLLHRTLRTIEERHREEPFHLAQAMWADEPGYLATRFARSVCIPSVVHVLGGELVRFEDIEYGGMRGLMGPRLIPRALARASAVIVGSRFQDDLAQNFAPPERRRTLPLGVDVDLFSAIRSPKASHLVGNPALLFVASLVPVKRPLFLLAAFREVLTKLPEAHLHIIGEGYLRGHLEQECRDLDLTGNRTFHGSVPHDTLPDAYAQADLTLLCSRHEGQALCVLESAACGTIVVGSNVGIVPDLPECITVQQDDPGAFAEAIVATWAESEERALRSQRLTERVRQNFSIEETVRTLLDLYRELIEESHSPR